MNEASALTPSPETAPSESTLNTIELPVSATDKTPHRKTANLPRKLRDLINSMLDDNRSAREIIEALRESNDPTLPYEISEMCISRWRNSGYKRYLAAQERITDMLLLRENASDLMQDHDILSFHKAVNQLAVGQIFKTLIDDTLADDPMNRTRTMNALSRLSREALVFKKYEDSLAKDQPAAALPQLDEERKLNENEQNLIQDRWDQAFKIHPNHLRSKTPITPEEPVATPPVADDVRRRTTQPPSYLKTEHERLPSPDGKDDCNKIPSPRDVVPNLQSENLQPSTCAMQPTAGQGLPRHSVPAAADEGEPPVPNPQSTIENPEPHVGDEVTRLKSINPDAANQTSDICVNPPVPQSALAEAGCPSVVETPAASEISVLKTENGPLNTDLCPQCGTPTPPLLRTGERPLPHCSQCGLYLPPPITPHLSHASHPSHPETETEAPVHRNTETQKAHAE
jgi:hypothetical protein